MKRKLVLVLVGAASLAVGCTHQKREHESGGGVDASSRPVYTSEAAKPAPVGGAFSLPGEILLPPAEKGTSVSRISGCLAQSAPSEADGSAFPARASTRGPAPQAVTVTPTTGGIVVQHALDHACCLKGGITSAVEGDVVTLTETLEGEACRCRCASTLKTAVGLAPGDYTLKVVVAEPGSTRTAYEAPVQVR